MVAARGAAARRQRLRNMTDETKSILMNSEVIAIDQDPAGRPPTRYPSQTRRSWSSPASCTMARDTVGLFNRGEQAQTIAVEWARDRARRQDIARPRSVDARRPAVVGQLVQRVGAAAWCGAAESIALSGRRLASAATSPRALPQSRLATRSCRRNRVRSDCLQRTSASTPSRPHAVRRLS